MRQRKLPAQDMQVSTADPDGFDLERNLPRTGRWGSLTMFLELELVAAVPSKPSQRHLRRQSKPGGPGESRIVEPIETTEATEGTEGVGALHTGPRFGELLHWLTGGGGVESDCSEMGLGSFRSLLFSGGTRARRRMKLFRAR